MVETNHSVLVVDDEPQVLRVVASILSTQGFETVPCSSADAAVLQFSRMDPKPCLVISDVVMPGDSGPVLAERLRAIDPDVKVLFMSAYDDRQVVQRYVVQSGMPFIAKPFTASRLLKSVRETVEAAPAI
jgi:DNA-binding NtrC family response regulator